MLCVLQQVPVTPWALPVCKLLHEISLSVKKEKKKSIKTVVVPKGESLHMRGLSAKYPSLINLKKKIKSNN